MKLSVAMCTYNGSRYLAEQLTSILEQERIPNEVIICDDGSKDHTPDILREFAARASFPVSVIVNPENLGSTRNFEQAIRKCNGDIIVLSDQDDVWLPTKLAILERTLQENVQAGFVFSDAEMVDEKLLPLPYTLWEAVGFSGIRQKKMMSGKAFHMLVQRYAVTGATMAFRSSYRDCVLPIPAEWVHDDWIALLISALAPCCLVRTPLVRYRQHPNQQIGERKRSLYQQYLVARDMSRKYYQDVANKYSLAIRRLESIAAVSPHCLDLLRNKVDHFQVRSRMRDPSSWRLPHIVRETLRGRYNRFSFGWKSIAQDLLL